MPIFRFILLSLVFLNSFIIDAQHKDSQIELTQIEVIGKEIQLILDSFVKHEQKCDYYSNDLIFTMNIKKYFDSVSIIIESIDDKNIAFRLKPYGFFCYENHLFLLYDDKLEELFIDSSDKIIFKFIEYDFFFKEYNSEGRLILRGIIDDSFTQWGYTYLNEKLYLVNKASLCE